MFLEQKVQGSALIKRGTPLPLPASFPRICFLSAFEAGPFRNPQWASERAPHAASAQQVITSR